MSEANSPAPAIDLECDLPEPPEKVWRALSEPKWLGRWLLPTDLRAFPGARFSFRPTEREAGPIACEVLEVEPPRRLRWRQREVHVSEGGERFIDSVVTIDLGRNANGGTHLRLQHNGFEISSVLVSSLSASSKVVGLKAQRRSNLRRSELAAPIECCLRWAA